MERKNQNKCWTVRVVLRNIYQIFRPITLLKHMLITNQFAAYIYCSINSAALQIHRGSRQLPRFIPRQCFYNDNLDKNIAEVVT